jgi:hypothetical protein
MTIRDYLCREAEHITRRTLAEVTDAAAWHRVESDRRRQFREMLGLTEFPFTPARPPVPVTVTGVVERPLYRIEKLHYESLPGLFITANLYVPRNLTEPAPGVLYLCGHAENQKVYYQAHPRRFAELGFVCLIAETIQLGEIRGYHHGCYREGWFHWYSRGYTPASIEAWNGIRALDLLTQRSDVDADRLGVTGTSGGGASSWWIAATDERVRVAAPSCATSTLESHVVDRMMDDHCDCMWWINTYLWDLADVGALIAPRPLMIASSDRDSLNTIAAIRKVHAQLVPLYEMLDVPENLKLVATPGPHAYHEQSRTAIFSWFMRHLMNRDISPATVGDTDDAPARQESAETLRVFTNGFPSENRTATIQDDLFVPPVLPEIADQERLEQVRRDVIHALHERTFRAFPTDPPPLEVRIEYEFLYKTGRAGCRFQFASEEGWDLHGRFLGPTGDDIGGPASTIVVSLRSPGEVPDAAEAFAGKFADPWAVAAVEPRGTGDTAWGPELQWHVRRSAAWTGRTIASMQVWDTLRAIEAVRRLPMVRSGARIALAAQGDMAVVALYAALIDGRITTLFLDSPPASQNVPSAPDGRGPAIEMLNCLQITDLPQVASLVFPALLVISGDCPASYTVAEKLYATLGKPEAFRRIGDISRWQVV